MSTTLRRALTYRLHLHYSPILRRTLTTTPPDTTPKMKKRAIVSSFICTPADEAADGERRFALFRRSQDVSTYRGKWAVCSGSIEPTDPTPLAAARREILEETRLSTSDITLLRRGRPFLLRDDALEIEWCIHPFAFVLRDPAKRLVLDFEHVEYRLVTPDELGGYDTVPELERTARRVLPGREVEGVLASLRDDHKSGAAALGTLALRSLRRAIYHPPPLTTTTTAATATATETATTTPTDLWRSLRLLAWTLSKNGRPAMAPAIEAALFAALERIMLDIGAAGAALPTRHDGDENEDNDEFAMALRALTLDGFRELAATAVDATIAAREERAEELAGRFVEFVVGSGVYREAVAAAAAAAGEQQQEGKEKEKGDGDREGQRERKPLTILTLSESASVSAGLVKLGRRARAEGVDVRIVVLESRPRFEGVAMARGLVDGLGMGAAEGTREEQGKREKEGKVEVEICTDASVAWAVNQADFVVLGADKVSPEGDVSNKTGSLAAASLAKMGARTRERGRECRVVVVCCEEKIVGCAGGAAVGGGGGGVGGVGEGKGEWEGGEGGEDGRGGEEENDPAEVVAAWPAAEVGGLAAAGVGAGSGSGSGSGQGGVKVKVWNSYFEWVPRWFVDVYVTEGGEVGVEGVERVAWERGRLEERLFGDL